MTHTINNKQSEAGFTLVELAIVMIIIGLLLGGVLKGQELIANAQISNLAAQMKGLQAAHVAFLDRYGQNPGDLANAGVRIPNCATPCQAGNANGRIDLAVGAVNPNGGTAPSGTPSVATGEAANFFLHMFRAEFIGNMTGNGTTASFGTQLPTSTIGGGFMSGSVGAGLTPTGFGTTTTGAMPNMRPGFYVINNGTNVAVGPATGSLTANQAAAIDRKIDDGQPDTGIVVGDGAGVPAATLTGTECQTTSTATVPAVYREGITGAVCAVAFKTF